jgi:hypothetical protein
MKLIIFLLVSGFFYLFAAPASANNFGALAYDRQSNAYGVAWDMPSQAGPQIAARWPSVQRIAEAAPS